MDKMFDSGQFGIYSVHIRVRSIKLETNTQRGGGAPRLYILFWKALNSQCVSILSARRVRCGIILGQTCGQTMLGDVQYIVGAITRSGTRWKKETISTLEGKETWTAPLNKSRRKTEEQPRKNPSLDHRK